MSHSCRLIRELTSSAKCQSNRPRPQSSVLESHPNVLAPLLQSLSPPAPRCHGDEEEEDLNKAFDVQCFQQILCPAARSPPEKHRVYDERDFEGETSKPRCHAGSRGRVLQGACPAVEQNLELLLFCCSVVADHRHSSLHVHHPLSKPPADSRRRRSNEGRRDGRRSSAPSTATTIEEDQEDDDPYSQTDGEEDLMTSYYR